jgi:SNF2 family DNA or RNA helicase
MNDIPPWNLCDKPSFFYSKSGNVACKDYDYSTSMAVGESHLRNVVLDVLGSTHPGTLVRAEFRLRDWDTLKAELDGDVNEAVHEISELKEALPAPKVRLARTLRPDQQQALRFVIDSEESAKKQTCCFKAFVRMDPEISVGWQVVLKKSFKVNTLNSGQRWELEGLTSAKLLRVLTEPGVVSEIDLPRVTVGWFLDGSSFSLRVHRSDLEFASKSSGAVFVGRNVHLLRPDASYHISTKDVGVVTSLDKDGRLEACFPQCFHWKGDCNMVTTTSEELKCACAELSITVTYELWGSICAQKMGWGKTPLMAALMKHKWDESNAACSSMDPRPRSTSLVIVPPKIFRQWVNELRSWLGVDSRRRLPWGASWIKTTDGLTIWAPVDMAAFKERSAEQVTSSADIVVLSHSLFKSDKFPSDSEPWPAALFNVLGQKWSRVILDEAHELSGLTREQQRRILALQSNAVHVLSGTPEQGGGSRGAASLALAFKVSLCPMIKPAFTFDGDQHVTAAAREFFKSVARTQASPFSLPVTEHVVNVQLTEAEKVLYADRVNELNSGTKDLLEICCCFVSVESSSAKKEIGALIKKKRNLLQEQLSSAKGHSAFLLLLALSLNEKPKLASKRDGLRCKSERQDFWEEGRRMVDGIFEELEHLGPNELMGLVKAKHVHGAQSKTLFEAAEALWKDAASHTFYPLFQALPDRTLVFREQLDQHLGQYYVAVGGVKKPLDFLERSMKELAEGGSCPICLDGLENGEATCMTSCGHAFHEACLEEVKKCRPECPNCRQISEVFATKPPTPVDPWLKYGSKVKIMIQKLKDIMLEYPGERLLLFVQYRDMRQKLEKAFKEFEVPFLTLHGSARVQGAAITRWQSGQDPKDFLMMLSCEEHNSGITLTRARRDQIFCNYWEGCKGNTWEG